MLNPKLSAIRSIPSRSSFLGNNAAINEYPGRKSTNGSPKIIRIGEISFKGGTRTKGMHKRVKRITSARSRSFRKCLSVPRMIEIFMLTLRIHYFLAIDYHEHMLVS